VPEGQILHQNFKPCLFMCILEQFHIKANVFFFMMSESEGNIISSVESCKIFSLEEQGLASLALSGNQESCCTRVVRRGISCPDEPDEPECVKNYEEAVAEQWAKIQITLYSFHRATPGVSHPDRMKLKGVFQPSGP